MSTITLPYSPRLWAGVGVAAGLTALLTLSFVFWPQAAQKQDPFYGQDFSSGNRNAEIARCWTFVGAHIRSSSGNGVLIEGPGLQTQPLSAGPASPSQLVSPCTYFAGSGRVIFSHYLHSLADSSWQELNLIAVSQTDQREDTLFTHVYRSSGLRRDTVSFALDGKYKLAWRWWGRGGNGRAWLDQLRIEGELVSDPDKRCACHSGAPAVEWLALNAEPAGLDGKLSWATAFEGSSDYFEIERSLDGELYQVVGRKDAAGSSQSLRSYEFRDAGIAKLNRDRVLYRLRMVGRGGQFTYSQPIELRLPASREAGVGSLETYPNPAREVLNIRYQIDFPEYAAVHIVNAQGKTIYYQKEPGTVTANELRIPVENWPAGMYFVQVQGSGFVLAKKIMHY